MLVKASHSAVYAQGLGWCQPDRLIIEAANWGLVRFQLRHPIDGRALWELPQRQRYEEPRL